MYLNNKLKTDNSGMKDFQLLTGFNGHLIPSSIIYNIQYNYCISGFEATILMQTIRKYLVYGYVPIVERAFRSDTRESCVAQRSIYVILRGNEETRRYIHQVRMY